VGGIVYDTIGNGQQLAKTALRIAAGAPAAEIPSVEGIRTAQFDARALDRWNLRHQLLPPHSRILFHSPGFWERYRGYAWAALSLLLLQSMLIAGLLVQRVRRRRAERSLRDSEAALRTSAGQSQDLAGRLIAAQEDERRRLATDLNDDLSQGLALLSIELEQLERRRPPAGASQPSPLKAIVARVAEIATSVHEISHRLHPARLELVGLSSSIGGLCRDVSAKHGVEIDFREEDLPAKIDADITICLYRVVQEALRNITRHSGASDVTISLSFKKGKFLLFVADSGKGFDVERRPTTGLGLVSMRERVNFLNGRLVVHSERGEGTILFVEIPCSVGASGRSAVA
jgi:signal transduction histidine kinase